VTYSQIWPIPLVADHQSTGWSEPAATNAPVEDEVVPAILRMTQKPILFPCPGI